MQQAELRCRHLDVQAGVVGKARQLLGRELSGHLHQHPLTGGDAHICRSSKQLAYQMATLFIMPMSSGMGREQAHKVSSPSVGEA